MLTRKIGEGGRWLLEKIVDLVASTGINPNLLTFFGLLVNGFADSLFAMGKIPRGSNGDFFCRLPRYAGWTGGAAGKARNGLRRIL